MEVQIEDSWKAQLQSEFNKPYFAEIRAKYYDALKKATILPPPKLLFNAFNLVPFSRVKVVILGQDPYHNIECGIAQAMGLSFSVPQGVTPPPSLKNIFKEIKRDLGLDSPQSGDLSAWARQGVLLLNALLSVELGKALSHKDFGWEIFTDKVIEILSRERENIVFMLWGNYARGKKSLIDSRRHLVLEAPHPSPLARGFIGCGHFSKCNEFLRDKGIAPINWILQ